MKTLKEKKAEYYKKNKKKIKAATRKRYWENRDSLKPYWKNRYKKNRKRILKEMRTIKGRHRVLLAVLRKEKAPKKDLLWSLNFYAALLFEAKCYYCDGELNETGYALDAKDNNSGHRCWNVIPCCRFCNQKKMDDVGYEDMLEIKDWLTKLRNKRGS